MTRDDLKKIVKEEIVKSVFYSHIPLKEAEEILPGDPDVNPSSSIAVTASLSASNSASLTPTTASAAPLTPQGNVQRITRIEAVDVVLGTKGRIFTILFVKKDSTDRLMNCRLGVKKYLKGGSLRWDPIARGMLPVFDLQKMAYRIMNFKTLKLIKIGQITYDIT